jgi:hypothetical protein
MNLSTILNKEIGKCTILNYTVIIVLKNAMHYMCNSFIASRYHLKQYSYMFVFVNLNVGKLETWKLSSMPTLFLLNFIKIIMLFFLKILIKWSPKEENGSSTLLFFQKNEHHIVCIVSGLHVSWTEPSPK